MMKSGGCCSQGVFEQAFLYENLSIFTCSYRVRKNMMNTVILTMISNHPGCAPSTLYFNSSSRSLSSSSSLLAAVPSHHPPRPKNHSHQPEHYCPPRCSPPPAPSEAGSSPVLQLRPLPPAPQPEGMCTGLTRVCWAAVGEMIRNLNSRAGQLKQGVAGSLPTHAQPLSEQ